MIIADTTRLFPSKTGETVLLYSIGYIVVNTAAF